MSQPNRPPLMTLTDAAAKRVQSMIDARDEPTAGIRIS